jgi:hypothetical protein
MNLAQSTENTVIHTLMPGLRSFWNTSSFLGVSLDSSDERSTPHPRGEHTYLHT